MYKGGHSSGVGAGVVGAGDGGATWAREGGQGGHGEGAQARPAGSMDVEHDMRGVVLGVLPAQAIPTTSPPTKRKTLGLHVASRRKAGDCSTKRVVDSAAAHAIM